MRRIMFLFCLCLCVGFSTVAQNVEEEYSAAYANKRGVYLLPQAGDFALGIDASPLLRYMGNFFSSGGNYAPWANGVDQTIYGKYFLKDNRAIRARLSVYVDNDTYKGVVRNDAAYEDDPTSTSTLIDIERASSADFELGIGYEFRRGNGRVQGFWGGEVAFGFGSGKTKYDYANSMTTDRLYPSINVGYYDYYNRRITEDKAGNTISFGLGAFVGVEYFFAPQMSLGGEFGLGFGFSTSTQNQTTWESWDTYDDVRKIDIDKDQNWYAQNFGVLTRTSGRLFLMFHF